MAYADTAKVEAHIADLLNAQGGVWNGSIIDARRGNVIDSIRQARIESGMEILRAIARNPQHGYYGPLSVLTTVAHNAFLPVHDGEPGVPLIVPYSGAAAREGRPRSPDQIDSYRNDLSASPIYSGALDGAQVAHNQADADGRPSPVSCLYSLVNGRFKFTGHTAQIPLVQLTRAMADTAVPETYEPTLVKLSIPRLTKEGDNLAEISERFRAWGQEDLLQIEGGAMKIRPVPNVVLAQRAGV